MDDKTLQGITDLATKLGTTAEYLWGVLIRQAPIEGTVNLILMVSWTAATVWWFRFVMSKTTPAVTDESIIWAWISVILIGSIVASIVGYNLPLTIATFLNPGYWALKQIIK